MLHKQSVIPGTLALLNHLSQLDVLNGFSLVGGTALALRYGHRHSVDLDFFNNQSFDRSLLIDSFASEFGKQFIHQETGFKKSLFCTINDVKVDMVYYPHPIIRRTAVEEGVVFYSDEDIAAMKIQAILGRGKKKDFWDLALLLENYKLSEMIGWHEEKFPNQMLLISIPQTITYFDDADLSENPDCLRGQTWEEVKTKIRQAVNEYLM